MLCSTTPKTVRHAITKLGLVLPSGCDDLRVLDEDAIVEAIQSQQPPAWTDVPDCPRLCQSHGVKDCTYYVWFMRPSSCENSGSYTSITAARQEHATPTQM
jgi:hypothetical protein